MYYSTSARSQRCSFTSGSALSVKYDMRTPLPAVHFRVTVRSERTCEEEDTVGAVWHLFDICTESSRHKTSHSHFKLGCGVAHFHSQNWFTCRLECKQTNCSVTFSAALHFIDGCPDSLRHDQCRIWRAIISNSGLEIWLTKSVTGYISSIRGEGLVAVNKGWRQKKGGLCYGKGSQCEIINKKVLQKNVSP